MPEEEDADDSQVEDPEKCSEAETVKIIEQVGEALEENFTQLEKMKAAKASKAEAKDVEMADGGSKDTEAIKTNGDSKDAAKINGDSKEVVEANGESEKMDEDKKPGNLP